MRAISGLFFLASTVVGLCGCTGNGGRDEAAMYRLMPPSSLGDEQITSRQIAGGPDVIHSDSEPSVIVEPVIVTGNNVSGIFTPAVHVRVRVLYADTWNIINGPQAFIVLVRGQDTRNIEVCGSIKSEFGMPLVAAKNTHPKEIPVYWPDARKTNAITSPASFDCGDRVSNYDYEHSDDAITNLRQRNFINDRTSGPILIALRTRNDMAFALDLSQVPSDGLKDVFAKWHDELLVDAALWDRRHLSNELFRQKLRYYLHDASNVIAVLAPLSATNAWAGPSH